MSEVWVVQENDWENEPVLGVAETPEAGIRMVQAVYKDHPDFTIRTQSADDGGVDVTIDKPHGGIDCYSIRKFEVEP